MKTKRIAILFLLLCLSVMLASCKKEVTVTKTSVNDELHLIVEYSDGSTKDMGYIGVADESKNITVKSTQINEELHLIVEYSDGTVKDMGYVGVEPPLYTVTFVDINGNVLSVQEVYKGRDAKAPVAPSVADKVFSGWDQDFTNVQSDLTVKPVYQNAAEYTVVFKDSDGTVLKTQKVISGHSATAPSVSNKSNQIFIGWDKSFDNVKSDLTVTAQYRAKKTLTVTFKDYSGLVLGSASVKEGDTAKAPAIPTREGYQFIGWSSSLENITSDKTVTAKYKMNGGNNIMDVSYVLNSNRTVTVTFAVKGTVEFCGAEGHVELPDGLTYKSLTQGDGATANFADGKIYFMFASNSGTNVTADTTIMTVTFEYSDSFTSGKLKTIIEDIYDQNYDLVNSSVVGGEIKVK